MKLGRPSVRQEGEEIWSYRVPVRFADHDTELWFTIDGIPGDFLSDLMDGPLVGLLVPAMARGEDIIIEGPVSERLHHSLSEPVQRLLQCMYPQLRQIRIMPEETRYLTQRGAGVITGFSAGIDSFCTLADHHYSQGIIPSLRLTHLLFNNVGSHSKGGEKLFRERYALLKPTVEKIGLPMIQVNSNLHDYYDRSTNFQKTHTLRNAAVAMLLQKGIGRYLYSSTYHYREIFIGKSYDIAYSDPILLPMISSDGFEVLSVGGQYTRVEKTLRVADIKDAQISLDVCVKSRDGTNCSHCWKCMRTQLTLEIAGSLEKFSEVFDLNEYRKHRNRYIAATLASNAPLEREIIAFARTREFAFPMSSHMRRWGYHESAKIVRRLAGRRN